MSAAEQIPLDLDPAALPDDLTAYGMRRYHPPADHYILWPDERIGVSFVFPTLERNIVAAREFIAAHEEALARVAAQREAEAAKPRRRKRAASG